MPRIPRADDPGSWHHVFNRGIARRTLFERRQDFRFFLANIARAVRRGELEIHAYSLMPTHYHLLVRSPDGALAEAMHRIQLAYSRWFNRSRRRDGSLVRGRYGSKPVHSLYYRRVLVRYIDLNPCAARLVDHPSRYPWGSAAHYSRPAGPAWLERGWVESEMAGEEAWRARRGEAYDGAFPPRSATELSELVHARLAHDPGEDLLDDVVGGVDPAIRAWMTRKAILADGTRPGLPLLPLSRLDRMLGEGVLSSMEVRRGTSTRDGRDLARVGLGRDLCGATLTRLAAETGFSTTKVGRLYAIHRAELEEGTTYAARVIELARRGIEEWKTV